MSRALNVTATAAEVKAIAATHGVRISAIETIPARGTRVVFMNADDAARMRDVFAERMLVGTVVRTKFASHD